MARLLGPVLVLFIQVLGTFAVGCWLLLTPGRAANLLHDAFVVFPQVGPEDHLKKLCLRILGSGLVVVAARATAGFVKALALLSN